MNKQTPALFERGFSLVMNCLGSKFDIFNDVSNNFFVTFIEVLRDREGASMEVEAGGITTGDYLQGFFLGTRDALSEKNRHSLTITVNDISPRTLGMLIALYERAVGLYAALVGINAYHQPGVEAGKKAAKGVLQLQTSLLGVLQTHPQRWWNCEQLAEQLGCDQEAVFLMMRHLAANRSQLQSRGSGLALELAGGSAH